jgi:B9 domain-containing protein 1
MDGSKISLNEDKTKGEDNKDKESDIPPKKRGFPKRLKKFIAEDEQKNTKKKKTVTEINEQLEEGFILNVQGMIELGEFFDGDIINCKYDIEFGQDWELLNGLKTNQSQQACRTEGKDNFFIWNMPFEVCLRSTNPSGWPQLVVSCYGPDWFGREVLKAYGVCYFPTTKGSHERTLHMFSIKSSSGFIEAIGIFLGQKAEILNAPNVLSTGEGREVIRAQSEGIVKAKFNINITNMEYFGYNQ